jgi:hypothetical protein
MKAKANYTLLVYAFHMTELQETIVSMIIAHTTISNTAKWQFLRSAYRSNSGAMGVICRNCCAQFIFAFIHKLTKSEIRSIAKEMDLPVWDKPSKPCMATRIPYGAPITQGSLKRIMEAEEFLITLLNEEQVRVREHGKDFYRAMLGNETSPYFIDELKRVLRTPITVFENAEVIAIEYMLSGVVGVICYAIQHFGNFSNGIVFQQCTGPIG